MDGLNLLLELVASFPECRRFSPWPRCKPRAAYAPSAARKMRGTPRQSLGRNARDRRLFCSVLQKCTGRTYLHFLLTPQEVRTIGKTRNQFIHCDPHASRTATFLMGHVARVFTGGRPSVWRRNIHCLLALSLWQQGAHSGVR